MGMLVRRDREAAARQRRQSRAERTIGLGLRARSASAGLAAAFAVLLSSSCASTSLLTSWADPSAAGQGIGTSMVIGVSDRAVVRRQFEDIFVARLNELGGKAIPSYPLLPDASAINERSAAPVVERNRIEHLVIVRVVDKKTVTTYVPPTSTTVLVGAPPAFPPYYNSWHAFYGFQYSTVTMPGYTYQTEYVNLETNVYDLRSDKLIWSGLTETQVGSKLGERMKELVRVLTAAMKKDGIL